MSLIRMLACCCDGGGPDGPGTDSPLCTVVSWCYSNKKIEPDLVSFATTGTKPAVDPYSVQATNWATAISGVSVTSKTYLGASGNQTNRWQFDIEYDWTAVYSGSSGSTDCGCLRAGVWEAFDTTSFSGTSQGRIILGCDFSTTPNHSIQVQASHLTGGLINPCTPDAGNVGTLQVTGSETFAGPYPRTLMDTCTELESFAMAFDLDVKILGGADGCGTEAQDGNLHRITLNFAYQ